MIYWISCIWHFKMDLRYSFILQSILRFPFVLFPEVCLSSHYEVLTAEWRTGWVILYENILRQHSDIVKVSNFLHSKGSVGVVAWGTDGLMIKTRNYSSLGLSVERKLPRWTELSPLLVSIVAGLGQGISQWVISIIVYNTHWYCSETLCGG